MQTTSYWISPLQEQDALTQITGTQFKVLPKTEILECVQKPTPQQLDVLRYLSLAKAIDMRVQKPTFGHNAHPGGLVWIDAVDPLKLGECREMLAVDLPAGLAAAKPTIEHMTGQDWTLNRASLTTFSYSRTNRLLDALASLEEDRQIKLDFRDGGQTIAIYDVSRRLMDAGLVKPPKMFPGPSSTEKHYDPAVFGQLDSRMLDPFGIFPRGQLRPMVARP